MIYVGLFLIILALYCLYDALLPRRKRRIRWGQYGEGPPLSAFGYGAVVATLLIFGGVCIVKGLGIDAVPDEVLIFSAFASVLMMMIAGYVDDRKEEA